MLADEANMQKQKKREEQLRKWREREMSESNSTIESFDKAQRLSMPKKETKVKFPKGCVFLAACSSCDIDEVRQHLKMGVNINTTNIDGLTALHQACIDANLTMVQFLVEHGADVNAQDNEGWTPLHAAVSVGNLEVVKYLIASGARLDVCNSDTDLPIDLCDAANMQMRDFLDDEMRRRDINADYEKRREEELMFEDAKEANFFDKVHNKTGATALHVSAAKGYLRVIKLLLQYNANVNEVDKDGWTPLHAAAHWEQEEACKLLIEHGASLDIKTYAGQTPFDVCDKEMALKLKAMQNKQQQMIGANNSQKENKLNDLYNNNNTKLDARVRRQSDELNKSSSITRLTNEAKSSISEREKKQDKILLSPITTTIAKPHFDLSIYSDSENDKINNGAKPMDIDESSSGISDLNNLKPNNDRFTFDKENLNRTNSYTNSISQAANNINSAGEQDINKPQVLNKSNSLNKPKTGLQENLKSLSAQVKLKMDEDKDEINDKHISLKSSNNNGDSASLPQANQCNTQSSSSTTLSPLTTGTIGSLTTTNTTIPIPNNSNHLNACSISTCSSSTNISSSNAVTTSNRPYSDRRWGNPTGQTEPSTYRRRVVGGANNNNQNQSSSLGSPIGNSDLLNPLSPNGEGTRRYSTAPIASKDEQAELIRKQKAKLERHFRRSTQAVSYEDIKSAEATIKGTNAGSNPSTPTIVTSPTTMIQNENIESSAISSSNLNGPIPPSTTTSTTSVSFNSSPTTPQILTTVPINSPPISQQGVSSLTSLFGEMINKNNIGSSSSSNLYSLGTIANAQQQSNSQAHQPGDQTTLVTTTNPTSGGGGDIAIANDIETDKLLNAIEKSKGFSDAYSTQAQMTRLATARLRNRAIPFPTVANSTISTTLGYQDRFQPKSAAASTGSLTDGDTLKTRSSGDDENKMTSKQLSPISQIRRINTGTSLEPGERTDQQQTSLSSTATHTRPMYRFGQNPASDNSTNIPTSSSITYLSSNTNKLVPSASTTSAAAASATTTVGVKRSFSQVPTSDRRGMPTTTTNGITSTAENTLDNSNKNFDFQAAYELMKKENELLNQTISRLQKELDEQNKDGSGFDKREKRALDRKISELEEEVKKIENLKQDNNRLKEENAALIRVISKLSK